MKCLITCFGLQVLSTIASAAVDTNAVGVERYVSLQNVPLHEGERVEEVHLQVSGAWIVTVCAPIDWTFTVGTPISGVANVDCEAGHGVAMPYAVNEFRRFVRIIPYKSGVPQVSGRIVLYTHSASGRESERALELGNGTIELTGSNQSPDPTPASVTAVAAQPPRQP